MADKPTSQPAPQKPGEPMRRSTMDAGSLLVQTHGQASRAASTSAEILAILENVEGSGATEAVLTLVRALAEQGKILRRIEAGLERVERHLGTQSSC